MKEISEYTLIGAGLILSADKYAIDSIRYESAKAFCKKVLAKLNKNSNNYTLLPIEDKMSIVKKMISKGVFKTDPSNKSAPFKQVYNYETSKHIFAVFSYGGNLTFKLAKANENPALEKAIKQTYADNLSLDIKNAIITTVNELKPKTK